MSGSPPGSQASTGQPPSRRHRRFTLFAGFVVDAGQFRLTGMLILVTGIMIGALGSAFAVSRFLDV